MGVRPFLPYNYTVHVSTFIFYLKKWVFFIMRAGVVSFIFLYDVMTKKFRHEC